jgi:hypothetical protein
VFLDAFYFLDELFIATYFQLNIEVTPTSILTGSGAFVVLWVLSSIVSAIDKVPLVCTRDIDDNIQLLSKCKNALICLVYSSQLPKFLELVGTGYSIWFIARYLLFKVHLNSQSPHETTLTVPCCVLSDLNIRILFKFSICRKAETTFSRSLKISNRGLFELSTNDLLAQALGFAATL